MSAVITLHDRSQIPATSQRLLERIDALNGQIDGLWRIDILHFRLLRQPGSKAEPGDPRAAPPPASSPLFRELVSVTRSDVPGVADLVGLAPPSASSTSSSTARTASSSSSSSSSSSAASSEVDLSCERSNGPMTMRIESHAVQLILDHCPHTLSASATLEVRCVLLACGMEDWRTRAAGYVHVATPLLLDRWAGTLTGAVVDAVRVVAPLSLSLSFWHAARWARDGLVVVGTKGSSYVLADTDYVVKLGTCKRGGQSKAVVLVVRANSHPVSETAAHAPS